MTIAMLRTDESIAADVDAELFFDPQVTCSDLKVESAHGHVTIADVADTYATKWAAETAALRVSGVSSVQNLITVDPHVLGLASDADLATAVRAALDWDTSIPANRLQVFVADGNVNVSGTVDWYYQRAAVEKVAGSVRGVRTVNSQILIQPPTVSPTEISLDIQSAFVRSARVDARHVTVTVEGGSVKLSGNVRSWAERREALDAAWRAKGVSNVVDDITIEA